jgi:hypothetical protein
VTDELERFHEDLVQELAARAAASGELTRTVFVEAVASRLVEAEEMQEWLPSYHDGRGTRRRAIGVDGYSAEELPLDGTLHLMIADLRTESSVQNLTTTEVKDLRARVCNFVEDARSGHLVNELEPSTPAADLARLVHEHAGEIRTLRVHVLSNASLGARFKQTERESIGKIKVELQVWDLTRLFQLADTGGHEPLEIDFTEFADGGLAALPASVGDVGYASYLCVVPGALLAEIYERHGSRLLEGNVRAFLSARGSVNKGLRNTILQHPEMFFAFNNGITATASDAVVEKIGGSSKVRRVTDLQIVNGGQTTASLFNARLKDDADLDRVFVQMKLSVLPGDVAKVLTPDIARYANTQNKVSDADLFANHPFHQKLEEISKRLWAPARNGAQAGTHWYYERARAQYQTDVSRLRGAEKRVFQVQFPESQVIQKTELALYDNSWRKLPHIVSLGAQKNFQKFAERVREEFEARPDDFNDRWYQHAVARAILFLSAEDLVSNASWYEGGYRRNIVTYAIARLVKLIEDHHPRHVLDLDRIWKDQRISDDVAAQLLRTAAAAFEVLTHPPEPWKNVTEWAKKEQCWQVVASRPVEVEPSLLRALKPVQEERVARTEAREQAHEDDAIGAVAQVVTLAAEGVWRRALKCPGARRLLTPTEFGILTTAAGAKPTWVPSDLQAQRLVSALKKLKEDGFE